MPEVNGIFSRSLYLEKLELGMKGRIGYSKIRLHLDRDPATFIIAAVSHLFYFALSVPLCPAFPVAFSVNIGEGQQILYKIMTEE